MENVILKVSGMSCSNCEKRLQTSIMSLNGVKSCAANHKNGEVKIEYLKEEISIEKLKEELENIGFEVV